MPLTRYPRGLSSFGVPLIGGGIPTTFGKYFFVDADNGDDGRDGLSPDTAVKSLSVAYGLTTSNKNDVVILSSNAAHVLTAGLTISKNRVHFVAAPFYPRKVEQRARVTMGGASVNAVAMITNTGMGNTFSGIKFFNDSTHSNVRYAVIDNGGAAVWQNCSIELFAQLAQTAAAELLYQGDGNRYIECRIGTPSGVVSVNRPILLFDASVGQSAVGTAVEFSGCRFDHWTSTNTKVHVKIAANGDVYDYAIFDRCIFATKVAEGTVATLKAFDPPATLTSGTVLLDNCIGLRVTDLAATGDNAGVYAMGPSVTAATVGKALQPTS